MILTVQNGAKQETQGSLDRGRLCAWSPLETHISGCVHHRFDFSLTGLGRLHLDVGSDLVLEGGDRE